MIVVFGATGFIGTYLVDRLIAARARSSACDVAEIGDAYCEMRGIPHRRVDIVERGEFADLPADGSKPWFILLAFSPQMSASADTHLLILCASTSLGP
ncbi:MAG: hypothetical protein R2862_01040 [Thermoanaerobaculia bacterium]